jgi:hypothetical protein
MLVVEAAEDTVIIMEVEVLVEEDKEDQETEHQELMVGVQAAAADIIHLIITAAMVVRVLLF